ncbi:hypothetical protein [Lysinibacillus sp. FSL W7-1291]|uniref:hypothetical protein n=1 Tax=Lysinibacillus sp. FSL W7-1291 TaxID=2954544 RepID=UPI003159A295
MTGRIVVDYSNYGITSIIWSESVHYRVEVKVVKNTIVLQADECERQPSHQRQKQGATQQVCSCNTTKLSQQQIHKMMQIIEEIRLKGYKETL